MRKWHPVPALEAKINVFQFIVLHCKKEVTKTEITRILQNEENPQIREKAYLAKIKGGDLIAEDLIEFVKMRNDYG